jgi:hypothetical protein
MKRGSTVGFVLACVILATGFVEGAQEQGMSHSNPAPIGATINTQIQCGSNPVSLEPYDLKITLLQVVRGEKAWELLRTASDSNKPAKNGFEYVLAQIRFELKAIVFPGDKSYKLGTPLQLIAMSADGKEYTSAPAVFPEPELGGELRAGKSAEGWIGFLVKDGDSKPLMAFDPASGGGTLRGKIVWFQLYR